MNEAWAWAGTPECRKWNQAREYSRNKVLRDHLAQTHPCPAIEPERAENWPRVTLAEPDHNLRPATLPHFPLSPFWRCSHPMQCQRLFIYNLPVSVPRPHHPCFSPRFQTPVSDCPQLQWPLASRPPLASSLTLCSPSSPWPPECAFNLQIGPPHTSALSPPVCCTQIAITPLYRELRGQTLWFLSWLPAPPSASDLIVDQKPHSRLPCREHPSIPPGPSRSLLPMTRSQLTCPFPPGLWSSSALSQTHALTLSPHHLLFFPS